jgi:hypothetical protein
MTCIVGIADNDGVTIGGERAASTEDTILSTSRAKVGIRGDIVYGYSGTIGIGQMIEIIDLPPLKDTDTFVYIKTVLVRNLKKSIDAYGGKEKEDQDTSWLIGCRGKLYELHHADWDLIEFKETSLGGGAPIALGSLYTSSIGEYTTLDRVGLALGAAITYSPSCQGPVDILTLPLTPPVDKKE